MVACFASMPKLSIDQLSWQLLCMPHRNDHYAAKNTATTNAVFSTSVHSQCRDDLSNHTIHVDTLH